MLGPKDALEMKQSRQGAGLGGANVRLVGAAPVDAATQEVPCGGQKTHVRGGSGDPPRHVALSCQAQGPQDERWRNLMQTRTLLAHRKIASLVALAAGFLAVLASPLAAESRDEWQQPDRVMADLNLKPGTTVADVGCGPGYFVFRLAKAVGPAGKVFAADIDKKALKAVADRARAEHAANVEVVTSDPTDTKLPPKSADAVFVCDVFHEVAPVADRTALMKSVVAAIKPGGFLFLIDYRKSHDVKFDPYEKLVPREDLVKLAADAGLVLDAEFHYLKYQVFLRFRKPG